MNVLRKYLTRIFFKMLALTVPGLLGIYLVIELFERLDDFIEAGAGGGSILGYFLFISPKIIYELMPMSVLLAALMSIMLLSKNLELTALRSVGVGPLRIFGPFWISALFLSVVVLMAQAWIIPKTSEMAQEIWQKEVKGSPKKGVLEGNMLFYHGDSAIWTTELASPDAKKLHNVQWFSFDRDFHFRSLIAAREAVFEKGKWVFRKGMKKVRGANETKPEVMLFDTLSVKLDERPEDFVAVETPPDEQGLIQLWKSVHRLKKSGYDVHQRETILWGYIFYPFLAFTLLFVALPFTLFSSRGSIGLGMSIGLAFGLAAWLVWGFALTLGKTGYLPPVLAPMAVHSLLLAAGWYLLRKLRA